MTRIGRTFAAFALCLAAGTTAVQAQSVSDEQQAQAQRVVEALDIASAYRDLPFEDIAIVEGTYVQNYPNFAERISTVVREEALNLADRYQSFQREAALVYARAFSADQLREIADFFESDTGQKLLSEQGLMMREVTKAAEIWQRGFRNDLDAAVQARMNALDENGQGGNGEASQ